MIFKKKQLIFLGGGKRAQQERALGAITDPGSVPRTFMVAHNLL